MYSIVAEESGLLPRERLLQKGAEVLSDQELLAIVLRTGTKSESVLSMANRILKGMTSLADLSRLSLNELQKIPGIGQASGASGGYLFGYAEPYYSAKDGFYWWGPSFDC